jgi:cytoskeletal protein CcmA (bactofilin family)
MTTEYLEYQGESKARDIPDPSQEHSTEAETVNLYQISEQPPEKAAVAHEDTQVATDSQCELQHTLGCIPAGVSFKGSITGDSSYEVQGRFEGSIALQGADLIIQKDADVDGTISARNATISGKVKGDINCQNGCVTFTPTAQCSTSLTYEQIVVERGAKLNAQIRTGE